MAEIAAIFDTFNFIEQLLLDGSSPAKHALAWYVWHAKDAVCACNSMYA